jgi:hypothetical protein
MRIHSGCTECTIHAMENKLPIPSDWIDVGELTDDGVATGRCPEGHAVNVVVQTPRHVLLFDSACHALIDGYYREAIGSFAASVERFYEFTIRVLWRHRDLGEETLDRVWSTLGSRSERQMGAFVALFAAHSGGPPKLMRKYEERRNATVHAGKLPTEDEAMEFGKDCYDHILDVTDVLRETAGSALQRENTMQVIKRARRLGNVSHGTMMSGTSPVALEVIRKQRPPFAEALASFNRWPLWVDPADRIRVRQLADALGVGVGEFLTVIGSPSVATAITAGIAANHREERK